MTAENYIKGNFPKDIMTLIPFGMLSEFDRRLGALSLLKMMRFQYLFFYLTKKFFKPFVNSIIDYKV